MRHNLNISSSVEVYLAAGFGDVAFCIVDSASGFCSTTGGGVSDLASGFRSVPGSGFGDLASGFCSVPGGGSV